MKPITGNVDLIAKALVTSEVVTVDQEKKMIKRAHPLPDEDTSGRRSIYAVISVNLLAEPHYGLPFFVIFRKDSLWKEQPLRPSRHSSLPTAVSKLCACENEETREEK